MNRRNRSALVLLLSLVLIISAQAVSFAALSMVGPVNAQNGFPLYYRDSNGLALQIGLEGDGVNGLSIYEEVIPDNPFSVQIGFGPEAFYWIADTSIAMRDGNDADLGLALEAAFFQEDPHPGDQFVFGRVRIRIDTPVAGDYRVIHPFGVREFKNVPAGDRGINFTQDIGSFPGFEGALASNVGPFLVAVNPPPPPGHVGDPQVEQTVTGSPFGTNYFRVEGPEGSNLDGQGNDFVQTDLFALAGMIYTGTPLFIDRTTYQRSADGQVDVFATSLPGAQVSFSGGTVVPETQMTGDSSGRFFGSFYLVDPSVLPEKIAVTATNPPVNTPVTVEADLVDFVNITKAEYDRNTQTLTVTAISSDALVPPSLTVEGYGVMDNGVLVVPNLVVPPAKVKVVSSAGGVSERLVELVVAPSIVIGNLKTAPAGSPFSLTTPQVVTAVPGTFTDGFYYIEQPDRAAAIKVKTFEGQPALALGDRITLAGSLMVDENGEKYLDSTVISSQTPGEQIQPLGMVTKLVQGIGLDTNGLLIRSWGKVTYVAPDNSFFCLDDGSGRITSFRKAGVPVMLTLTTVPITSLPAVGDFVSVVGIAGMHDFGTGVEPVIKSRSDGDISISAVE